MKDLSTKSIIGMIHLLPTPSTSEWHGDISTLYKRAEEEARIYKDHKIDALIIENTWDTPYERAPIHPATVSAVTVAAQKIKEIVDCPIGIQILAGGNLESLSVAVSLDLDFIRVEGYGFSHIADEGLIDASGPSLLRWRNYLKNKNIKIFSDIKKKHCSHKITEDIPIHRMASALEFMRSDGIIITGLTTGDPPAINTLKKIKESANLPVIIGSGVNYDNLPSFFNLADHFIIGSYFKKDNNWKNDIIPDKIKNIMSLKQRLLSIHPPNKEKK